MTHHEETKQLIINQIRALQQKYPGLRVAIPLRFFSETNKSKLHWGYVGNGQIAFNICLLTMHPDMIRDVVIHEFAHILVDAVKWKESDMHGPAWQAMVEYLGGTANLNKRPRQLSLG